MAWDVGLRLWMIDREKGEIFESFGSGGFEPQNPQKAQKAQKFLMLCVR